MKKRFLILPGNSSLSHLAKGVCIARGLELHGHEAIIGVCGRDASFPARLEIPYIILPDLPEIDGSPFPTVEWFRCPDAISRCVQSELDAIRNIRPNAVIGIFRFTAAASARITDLPFYGVACGSMLAECPDVLGFASPSQAAEQQEKILRGFYEYAGRQMSRALAGWHMSLSEDVRENLTGLKTFLWDIPEFQQLAPCVDRLHVGPLTLTDWNREGPTVEAPRTRGRIVISFGTCTFPPTAIGRLVRIACARGYGVDLVTGGHEPPDELTASFPSLRVFRSASVGMLASGAHLLICHGGQLTIFESLRNSVPVLVVPCQPEQAHNGVCLERIGCGKRLVPDVVFQGRPSAYLDALARRSDEEIGCDIEETSTSGQIRESTLGFGAVLDRYQGASSVVEVLEEYG